MENWQNAASQVAASGRGSNGIKFFERACYRHLEPPPAGCVTVGRVKRQGKRYGDTGLAVYYMESSDGGPPLYCTGTYLTFGVH